MQLNSKIVLKGQREPITVSETQAKKINAIFLDGSISLDQPLSVGGASFLKETIKFVEVKKDTEDSGYESKKPHWVIYSAKRNSIWQNAYSSFEEAKAEMPEDQFDDWEIVKKY